MTAVKHNIAHKQPAEGVALIADIYKLPLSTFIDCLCDDNYSGLIISGTPTPEQIETAWKEIMLQYTEVIGGSAIDGKLYEIKEFTRLQTRLMLADNLFEILKTGASVEAFEMLYTFGYSLPVKEFNEQNFNDVLKRFIQFYNKDLTKFELIAAVKKTKEPDQPDKPKRKDFTTTLARISIALKMPLPNMNELMTAQYCSYVSEYAVYCEQLEKMKQ